MTSTTHPAAAPITSTPLPSRRVIRQTMGLALATMLAIGIAALIGVGAGETADTPGAALRDGWQAAITSNATTGRNGGTAPGVGSADQGSGAIGSNVCAFWC